MDGYSLHRAWFDFAFENTSCKCVHTAIYTWIVELNNRLGWKAEFGLPTASTMEGLSIGDKRTYLNALRDLRSWGFIKIVSESKNQYQASIISLIDTKSEEYQKSTLDSAVVISQQQYPRHTPQHYNSNTHGIPHSTHYGTPPIDKQVKEETNKPENQQPVNYADGELTDFLVDDLEEKKSPSKVARKVSPKFDALSVQLPHGDQFASTWKDWVKHRAEKKSPLTELSVKKQLELVSCYPESVAVEIILTSITSGYQGLFPPKNLKNGQQQTESRTLGNGQFSDRLKSVAQRIANRHQGKGNG